MDVIKPEAYPKGDDHVDKICLLTSEDVENILDSTDALYYTILNIIKQREVSISKKRQKTNVALVPKEDLKPCP
jgi:hypothetical protein